MTLVNPEVFIGQAQGKFSADGTCTDSATREFVSAQMKAFTHWIEQVRAMNR